MRHERYSLWAGLVLLLVTTFRLFYINHLELVGDEAYYWLWSRHPDICYLDKGPVIAWFIMLGTSLFGQTVFGVRFFAVLLAAGTGAAMFGLARRLFSARVGFFTVVLAAVVPLYAVGSVLMTIDTVYLFFWVAAAWAFWEAKETRRWGPWVAVGVLLGLGILAKYTAALEMVSFALFCCWHRPSRRSLLSLRGAAMLLTTGLLLTPAVVWNAIHEWPTSRFLIHRGDLDGQARLQPLNLLTFLGGQAGVISPLVFLAVVAVALIPFFRPRPWVMPVETAYLLSLFWPLFGFYLLLSLQHTSEANWPAAAYVGGIILLAAAADRLFSYPGVLVRRLAAVALTVALMETIALHETSWLHLPHRLDPLDRARGWKGLAAQMDDLQHQADARFLIANKYMTAALLSFYLPGHPTVYMPVSTAPFNQLVMWPTYRDEHPSGDALLVSDADRVSPSIHEDFPTVEPMGTVETAAGDRKVNRFYIFACRRQPRAEHPVSDHEP
ncbi:MAG TPA: glycosyltransferase family 39 protein [Chthoniobacterales bacterium]